MRIPSKASALSLHGYMKRKRHYYIVCIILCLLLLVLSGMELVFGSIRYSLSDVIQVILGKEIDGVSYAVYFVRLPKLFAALFSGLAFGISGYIFQSILRNPLASPDVIGVSAGTSSTAVFCLLILNMRGAEVSIISCISGMLIAFLIYHISIKNGHFHHGRMILIGIGVAAMLRAMTSFFLAKAAEFDVQATMRWLTGSLSGVQMQDIPLMAAIILTCILVLMVFTRHLEIIPLGDAFSMTLGLNPKMIYSILVLISVFMISFATSVTGPIASIAFLSGPIAKSLVGRTKDAMIPSGLVGAAITMGADLIASNAFATNYPVGVITGLLGAPYMLYLLISMNQKGKLN